jgi:hypothetical protein
VDEFVRRGVSLGLRGVVIEVDLESEGTAEHGLRRYVRLVAEAVGVSGDCFCLQLEPPVNVYLALQERLRAFPTRDVALLWDEERGWSAAIETHSGQDLILVSYLGTDVLPPPRVVAQFVSRLTDEEFLGHLDPPQLRAVDDEDDLPRRLAAYAASGPARLDGQGGGVLPAS